MNKIDSLVCYFLNDVFQFSVVREYMAILYTRLKTNKQKEKKPLYCKFCLTCEAFKGKMLEKKRYLFYY